MIRDNFFQSILLFPIRMLGNSFFSPYMKVGREVGPQSSGKSIMAISLIPSASFSQLFISFLCKFFDIKTA